MGLDPFRVASVASRFSMVCAFVALLGSACSGSGSSANPEGGPTGGGPTGGDAYAISPSSLTFHARGGGPRPDSQTVQVTASAKVFLKTTVSGSAIESAMIEIDSDTTAHIVVTPAGTASVPEGTSTALVSIVGCADPVCSSEVSGSPKTVAITYIKSAGGITGMPNSLSFMQPFGTPTPPAQSVAVRDLGGESLAWTAAVEYQNASNGGWLALGSMGGGALPATVDVGVIPPAKAGSYQANVVFREGTTSLFTLPVTYALSADFQVMPTSLNVVGKQGEPTPDQTLSLTDPTGGSYPWTVKVEYVDGTGWASVSPDSGNTLSAMATLSLGTIPPSQTYSAVLRFTGAGVDRLVQVYYRQPP